MVAVGGVGFEKTKCTPCSGVDMSFGCILTQVKRKCKNGTTSLYETQTTAEELSQRQARDVVVWWRMRQWIPQNKSTDPECLQLERAALL